MLNANARTPTRMASITKINNGRIQIGGAFRRLGLSFSLVLEPEAALISDVLVLVWVFALLFFLPIDFDEELAKSNGPTSPGASLSSASADPPLEGTKLLGFSSDPSSSKPNKAVLISPQV